MKTKINMAAVLTIVFGMAISAGAQVIPDGTMGTVGNISGPEYHIKSEYGLKAGANLFHSFSRFDIQKNEIADFSVSNDVQNIISRITGGFQSRIDGTIRSTIADTSQISQASLFLLNPAGILFGAGASLDIGGSFHASAADYLRMGEHDRFYVMHDNDVLSSASPNAFGFLNNRISPVVCEGGEQTGGSQAAGLTVSEGNTLSLIGGNIDIQGTRIDSASGAEGRPAGNLRAPGGRINLAGVASPGEVVMTDQDLDVSSFAVLGNIALSDYAEADVSADGSGDIFIRSGEFYMQNASVLKSDTGSEDAGVIDIQADKVLLSGSDIYSDSSGSGTGGRITIHGHDGDYARMIEIGNFSRVFADTAGTGSDAGTGGTVTFKSDIVSISGFSAVSGDTFSAGHGGELRFDVRDTLHVSDAKIYAGSVPIGDSRVGDAGGVTVKTGSLILSDGGMIVSETKGNGKGGEVSIAADSVRIYGKNAEGNESKIYTSAFGSKADAGSAGNITIKADAVDFSDGGGIDAGTSGPGRGGDILIIANSLSLDTDASVTSASTSAKSGAGNAGSIRIYVTDSVRLSGGSELTTEAENAGDGKIEIFAGGKLLLTDSRITTSVKAGGDDAGDILAQETFIILNNSKVIANAWEGRGGNIRILGHLIQNTGSIVDASSQFGVDGDIYVESSEDVTGAIAVLPSAFMDAFRWVKTPCTTRLAETVSRFVVAGKDAVPTSHNDWFSSSHELLTGSDLEKSASEYDDVIRFSGF